MVISQHFGQYTAHVTGRLIKSHPSTNSYQLKMNLVKK